MKWIKYSRYTGDDFGIGAEDLLRALSDYLLQSGFNHTVAGLRERRRLEELFGRHVGAEVARKALDRGVALGGERAEASMLFVDLAGSTAFANSHAPETVVAALSCAAPSAVGYVMAAGVVHVMTGVAFAITSVPVAGGAV